MGYENYCHIIVNGFGQWSPCEAKTPNKQLTVCMLCIRYLQCRVLFALEMALFSGINLKDLLLITILCAPNEKQDKGNLRLKHGFHMAVTAAGIAACGHATGNFSLIETLF